MEPPVGDARHDGFHRHVEVQGDVDLEVLRKLGSLGDGARKAIYLGLYNIKGDKSMHRLRNAAITKIKPYSEKESTEKESIVAVGCDLIQDKLDDEFIRNEIPRFHESLRLDAEGRALANVLTKRVTSRKVRHSKIFQNLLADGSLSPTRWTHY
jgi:high-affinity K+ transport system ATPase subunit B